MIFTNLIFAAICSLPFIYGLEDIGSFPGQADLVGPLPGVEFSLGYRHYSGYLSSINNSYLHYWFFESQSGQPENDPVALWLNGGPGCSSLIGAFTELGPIRMNANGTLTPNPHSWTQRANVIFLETPTGVGFSYQPNVSFYHHTDEETVQVCTYV